MPMDANKKRDILRRTILELLSNGNVHYTKLEKKVCTTNYPFSTSNRFKSQLRYLLENKHINRIARGVYHITPKGKNYLALLVC
jgi:predicted transcriptional regulator